MSETNFETRDSQWVADILRQSLASAESEQMLTQWAAENFSAISRLAETDLQRLRAAYRAKRDELTGART